MAQSRIDEHLLSVQRESMAILDSIEESGIKVDIKIIDYFQKESSVR